MLFALDNHLAYQHIVLVEYLFFLLYSKLHYCLRSMPNCSIMKIHLLNVVLVYIDHKNVDMLEVLEENSYQQVSYNDYHNIHSEVDRLNNMNFYHNMKYLFINKYRSFLLFNQILTLILISYLFASFTC
jgi:hypothetical protein